MSDIEKTVIALQGNPIKREILGSSEDGYVLTWSASDDQWQSQPGVTNWAGDLAGSTDVSQQVISITGNAGTLNLSPNAANILWNEAASNPTIGQANPTAINITGTALTITAQGGGSNSGNGGNLYLAAGNSNNSSANGGVVVISAGNGNVAGLSGYVSIQAGGDYVTLFGPYSNGGDAVVQICKSVSNPTGAVSNAGILYVDSSTGNLMFLGSSGVARTVALA